VEKHTYGTLVVVLRQDAKNISNIYIYTKIKSAVAEHSIGSGYQIKFKDTYILAKKQSILTDSLKKQ
jgi:hypothetical protein